MARIIYYSMYGHIEGMAKETTSRSRALVRHSTTNCAFNVLPSEDNKIKTPNHQNNVSYQGKLTPEVEVHVVFHTLCC